MLRAFRTWLGQRALRRAQAERAAALADYRRAAEHRDTRRQHETARPAVHATCAELAACIGRAPSAWRGR